ncbi:glycoside hydrolase family 25 protein [Flavobacterium capsici]|uniref:Glycoside hydrolase family 25 protein n=1 Tax=Flavobacterium capsici TaxID=3075618 RepID=A0AA96F0P9_9FLAO|nr:MULTISPECIES: glycoside hydrolase family 25 protein [unclassified Flavobacterium]WNM20274.1 glycoside hydrolase family 25 protein [Flavobacterium sp. PMR2A8]WNM21664.1 glycoside hydrolase family 25 protein [Flavobacterium sp. PMTSA4]
MAKAYTKKPSFRRKNAVRKKAKFPFVRAILALLLFLLSLFAYHYRDAISFYIHSKRDSGSTIDKVAQARIHQVLKKHDDKTFGFDVSEYQGEIDWEVIDSVEHKFPLHFVFIRATAGKNKVDSRFKTNWKATKKHHLIRGAYHYYRPNENSVEQADNFIKTVVLQKGDLPPILDIEQMPESQSIAKLKIGLKRWLDRVEAHYKIKPIIYSGERYYTDFLRDEFSEYSFWIANYNFFEENIKDDWLFWQFTEKAVVEGINENVDLNIFNGTPIMLKQFTKSK